MWGMDYFNVAVGLFSIASFFISIFIANKVIKITNIDKSTNATSSEWSIIQWSRVTKWDIVGWNKITK